MSATETSDHDYSSGVPRHHHSLFIDDGNLVFQVENAIFKVHRSFLVKSSTVIKDMLDLPQTGDLDQANDRNPLVLTGDSAAGWALLLESHYESCSLLGELQVNGERLMAILPIAHKYCMEIMEGSIIKQLESVVSTAGYVDLLVASQIIDSTTLYHKALNALIAHPQKPTLDQARRVGVDAHFAIMEQFARPRCRYAGTACFGTPVTMKQQCLNCGNWQ